MRAADSLAAAGRLLAEDPAETLVVIGPRTSIDDALAFAAGLRADRPATGVVLVRMEVDVRVLSRALRQRPRVEMILGQPTDHLLERDESRRREHARLSHPAT